MRDLGTIIQENSNLELKTRRTNELNKTTNS